MRNLIKNAIKETAKAYPAFPIRNWNYTLKFKSKLTKPFKWTWMKQRKISVESIRKRINYLAKTNKVPNARMEFCWFLLFIC